MPFKKRPTPKFLKSGKVAGGKGATSGIIVTPGTKSVKGVAAKGNFGQWIASQLRNSGMSFEKSMGSNAVWYNQSTGEMVTVPKRVETQEQAKTVLRNIGVLKQD